MKRLLAVVLGGLGLGAFLKRRHKQEPAALGQDPAAELRAKLAESKAPASDELEPAPEPAAGPSAGDPESRRRSVHERARGAIDELQSEK